LDKLKIECIFKVWSFSHLQERKITRFRKVTLRLSRLKKSVNLVS
jgi:hypothetical protein